MRETHQPYRREIHETNFAKYLFTLTSFMRSMKNEWLTWSYHVTTRSADICSTATKVYNATALICMSINHPTLQVA